MVPTCNSRETDLLLQGASAKEPDAVPRLLARYRERLRRTVRLRLDRRLRPRVDSSAVLEQVQRDAAGRLHEYLQQPTQPFFLWLRRLTAERVQALHQQYLGPAAWDVGEVSLYRGALPRANSESLAAQLLGHVSPSQAAGRADLQLRLQDALNGMDSLDREVLALCHFEELSNAETAAVLGIDKAAASQCYVRALRRLKEILSSIPGLFNARPK